MFCLLFVGSLNFAQVPDSRPSGWDKGEKRGWDSEQPLGLEKKGQEHKDKWDSMSGEVEAAKEEAQAKAEKAMEESKAETEKAKEEAKARAETAKREAMKEKRQKHFWEFWK